MILLSLLIKKIT